MSTGPTNWFRGGDWNAVCYECGKKFKASDLIRYWQGYYLCKKHWNPRQPQDFARNVPDVQTPPWSQPMPAPIFGLDFIITEDSGTDFVAPNLFVTEDGSQPWITEN